jgi:hypothetical protein
MAISPCPIVGRLVIDALIRSHAITTVGYASALAFWTRHSGNLSEGVGLSDAGALAKFAFHDRHLGKIRTS